MRSSPLILALPFIPLVLASGCAMSSEEAQPLVQHASLSGCGGFASDVFPALDPREAYCDAEVLGWRYHEASRTLEVLDSRVLLNCCGDHHVEADLLGDTLVVTEVDSPEEQGARCGCMCTFDFALSLQGIPGDPLVLQVVRHITDDGGGEEVVWEEAIDPLRGAGSAVIDGDAAGMWCE